MKPVGNNANKKASIAASGKKNKEMFEVRYGRLE